jgi:hypothetical protein
MIRVKGKGLRSPIGSDGSDRNFNKLVRSGSVLVRHG